MLICGIPKRVFSDGSCKSVPISAILSGESAYPIGFVLSPPGKAVILTDWKIDMGNHLSTLLKLSNIFFRLAAFSSSEIVGSFKKREQGSSVHLPQLC